MGRAEVGMSCSQLGVSVFAVESVLLMLICGHSGLGNADVVRDGYVIGIGQVIGASCNWGCSVVRLLIGFDSGVGGDRGGFLSRPSVCNIGGSGRLTLQCGLIVPADGYGRLTISYVLGLVMVVRSVTV